MHDLIQDQWESDLPDRILAILKTMEGKAITTRLLDKLPGGKDTWRLNRHYGWTDLQNREYNNGDYKNGCSLMLARSEGAVPIDTAWIEKENTAYFDARKKRNHARMEALNTAETLDAIAIALNCAERAIAQLFHAQETIEKLTEYGSTLEPDRYNFLRACGLMDAAGQNLINRNYKEKK
jgi:hypothetical protein